MKVYHVAITETLEFTVQVTAENSQEAEQIVREDWLNCKYILSDDNFTDVKFEVVSEDM